MNELYETTAYTGRFIRGAKMGTVFWLAGLQNSGKTAVGESFYRKLKGRYTNTVFLDSAALQDVFETKENRIFGMQCARLCEVLQEQGMYVVCCTQSMPHGVSDWSRRNIHNYREICQKQEADDIIRHCLGEA